MAACSGLLEIAVVCANVGDKVAASECLVVVLYGGVEERTRKAKRGTPTPVWNQSFKLSVLTGSPTTVRFELRSAGLLKGGLIGAADLSVERVMHSGLEEVCIALLGKDGSKAADLQLALRFTAGSVTAGLAALAAAPPPPLPAQASGAQQPAPLPPAPPRAATAVKGPLEAGADGLTPRQAGAYPQLFEARPAARADSASPFDGALKAAQGVVQLAAYPSIR
ncbi:hypothetical protein WJX81_002938 [Elliptochloris bilobata]|uniref:C2 domain-containing protein n=1 Tax=Elliptochloris bilobata TaxID=381761 RepID=A0AAW1SC28_9CHLO